jgi:hypothetical protein
MKGYYWSQGAAIAPEHSSKAEPAHYSPLKKEPTPIAKIIQQNTSTIRPKHPITPPVSSPKPTL